MIRFVLGMVASACLLGFFFGLILCPPNVFTNNCVTEGEGLGGNGDIQIQDFFIETTDYVSPISLRAYGTYHLRPNSTVTTALKIVESQTVQNYTITVYIEQNVFGPFALNSTGKVENLGGGFKKLYYEIRGNLPKGWVYKVNKSEVAVITDTTSVNQTFQGPYTFIVL